MKRENFFGRYQISESKFMTDIDTIRHEDGRVRVENGECLVEKGSDQFVKRGECVKI